MQASFCKFPLGEKLGKTVSVREHRQCLLCLRATSQAEVLALPFDDCRKSEAAMLRACKLSEGSLRVLGCIGSLYKTHKGVTAHLWDNVELSGCGALHRQ